jgi:hypothetical protein
MELRPQMLICNGTEDLKIHTVRETPYPLRRDSEVLQEGTNRVTQGENIVRLHDARMEESGVGIMDRHHDRNSRDLVLARKIARPVSSVCPDDIDAECLETISKFGGLRRDNPHAECRVFP